MERNNYIEKKTINGKPNPKYVDLLDEDQLVNSKKYFLVSFLSPEEILKKKEIFYFEHFVKNWDFAKSMEKMQPFLKFLECKYRISMKNLNDDFMDFIKEEQGELSKISIEDDYKNFMDKFENVLQDEFNMKHNFQTNARAFKVKEGQYSTIEEAKLKAKEFMEENQNHDVFIGQSGVWMLWHPNAYKIGGDVEFIEEELNQLMKEKIKNEKEAKKFFDQRVRESKEKSIQENIKQAEKTGNMLTQNIDEQGNLYGIKNANTIEKEIEHLGQNNISEVLFEGENIVHTSNNNTSKQLNTNAKHRV
jgi:hypothetical protein